MQFFSSLDKKYYNLCFFYWNIDGANCDKMFVWPIRNRHGYWNRELMVSFRLYYFVFASHSNVIKHIMIISWYSNWCNDSVIHSYAFAELRVRWTGAVVIRLTKCSYRQDFIFAELHSSVHFLQIVTN